MRALHPKDTLKSQHKLLIKHCFGDWRGVFYETSGYRRFANSRRAQNPWRQHAAQCWAEVTQAGKENSLNSSAKKQAFMSKRRKKKQKVMEVNSSQYSNSTCATMKTCYLTQRQSARHCSSTHRQTLPKTQEAAGKEDKEDSSLTTPFKIRMDKSDLVSALISLSLVNQLHAVPAMAKQATYGRSVFVVEIIGSLIFSSFLLALNKLHKILQKKILQPFQHKPRLGKRFLISEIRALSDDGLNIKNAWWCSETSKW